MRTTVLKVSLFLCAFIILTSGKAGAISADYLALTDLKVSQSAVSAEDTAREEAKAAEKEEAAQPGAGWTGRPLRPCARSSRGAHSAVVAGGITLPRQGSQG